MKHNAGLDLPETVADAISRERTALIVYDMQVGSMRQLKDGAAVLAGVLRVLEAARDAGLRILFLRHLSLPVNLMGAFQIRQALAWQRKDDPRDLTPWFLRGSDAHALVEALAPRDTEAIFDKIGMSAFEGTPLDTTLRDCGISNVLLTGVAMEIGIEPTVRHAADLGYIPIVVEDACGAVDQAAGARAVASLRFMNDAVFTTVDEVTALLRALGPPR